MKESSGAGPGDRPPRPGLSSKSWQILRFGALAVAAAVALAVMLASGLGPGSSPTDTGAAGPTFNQPAALDAQVDEAGLMWSGGIWAVQGSYLLTSTDNGATWQAGTFPATAFSSAGRPVFVLDQKHAWTVAPGVPAGGAGGSAPAGSAASVQLTVDRTADGGRTWLESTVTGAFDCGSATLSFVDASNGYLMCAEAATAGGGQGGSGPVLGSGTVLRTGDGGASWAIEATAPGLGSAFTASDATTLWSAPDYESSRLAGASLSVSRDGGRTWSGVDLPELAAIPRGTDVGTAAGPVFWDALDGAFAMTVFSNGSGNPPAIWFYRTVDGGTSWTLTKRAVLSPVTDQVPQVVVGREWAAISLDGFAGLTASADFGSSWTQIAWSGMPANSPPTWLDFTDADHAAALVFAAPGTYALMLSSDGGATWQAAGFGDARAQVTANPALDSAAAAAVAERFQTMAFKDPPTAWNLLSSYSQRAFGGEGAFETAESALGKSVNYTGYQFGQPDDSGYLFSQTRLGTPLWTDLNTFSVITRAWIVVVTIGGSSETLVAAPLSATGEWRIWIASMPGAGVSPSGGS
jgi:hypothetical protein